MNPTDGWQPPTPFYVANLSAFPLEALRGWLRAFVEAEACATQTPPDLAGGLSLAICASACAGKIEVSARDGWVEPVNIYHVTVLPPGNRKSAVFADVVAPLEEFEEAEVSRMGLQIAEAESSRKILEQRLQRAQSDAAKAKLSERAALEREALQLARELEVARVPARPRLIVDDCSPERLATMLRDQGGRIAAMSPEGDIFDLMAGRYSASGDPNLGVYLKGHAGDTIRVDRVGRPPEYVRRPALTIGLTVQPDVLRGLAGKPSFRGRGLLGRLLYALPPSPLGHRDPNPPPMPPAARAAYRHAVFGLLQLPFGTDCPPSRNSSLL